MELDVLEHSLREGLRRHAAEVPPGAGERMSRLDLHPNPYRYAGARWAVPAVAASTVVSVGVVSGILASTGSGTSHIGRGPVGPLGPSAARTVAYRTTAAVAAASGSEIEHLQVSIGGQGWVKAISEQWVYGSSFRSEESAPNGSVLYGISEVVSGCDVSVRAVNYSDRTWYEGPGGAIPAGPDEQFAQSNVADEIRQELADGQLRSVGQTELGGRPALELNGVLQASFQGVPAGCPVSGPAAEKMAKAQSAPGWDYTVWVDPSTYLPMHFSGTDSGPGGGAAIEGSIEWLPADAQNLAQLVQPIPAGFTENAATAG